MSPWIARTLAALCVALTPALAAAQTALPPPPPPARRAVPNEPSASQIVQVALRYFRIHPEALDAARTAAQARALIPTISGEYTFTDLRYLQREAATGFQPRNTNTEWNQQNNVAGVEVSWDLRDAVFNPDVVQIFGVVGLQRDIMLEVTRTYFARRQLQLRLQYSPPEDPIAREALLLRVEEFTAQLDAMTGGWFSRSVAIRARGG